MKGRVLILAGSDSGGGAGIQADLKAVTALGGMGMTAITALTAQNSLGVHGVSEVPTAFIEQQFNVVFDDLGADAIKTGMLHSVPVIECVAALLLRAKDAGVPIIVDPVMRAKGGAPLLLDEAQSAFLDMILPLATLLTPNVPEAEALSGHVIGNDVDQLSIVGKDLVAKGADAVLMKGGHLDGAFLRDVLVSEREVLEIVPGRQRVASQHTHGTGCTLASATACGVAQGLSIADAAERAVHYVDGALRRAPGFGAGHGPIDHGWTVERAWQAG